jgi:hypothetical protein
MVVADQKQGKGRFLPSYKIKCTHSSYQEDQHLTEQNQFTLNMEAARPSGTLEHGARTIT